MPTGVYIRQKGRRLTKEHKIHLSEAHKGQVPWCKDKKLTAEHKEKLSQSHKGLPNSMKGKALPEVWRQRLSESHKGYKYPPDRQCYWKGKTLSESHKENIRKGVKGNLKCGWNRGLNKYNDVSMAKMANSMKGKHFSPNTEFKKGHNKGVKYSDERVRNSLRRRIPTTLESHFQNIINKNNLSYKYVGDGSFIIAGYNPDFINTNGEKVAIEVYSRYYKEKNNISVRCWKNNRQKKFNEYGWRIIFFDETQVKEQYVLNKLSKINDANS